MRIGIITLYHNSFNYGGNLQAYALYKFLENKGADVEQITYERTIETGFRARLQRLFKNGPIDAVKKVIKHFRVKQDYIPIDAEELGVRRNAFQHFMREIIRHSERVYDQNSIHECVDDYDVFVTGSDQVWNFAWYDSAYFLDFVDGTKKKKFSYATSFSMKELTDEQKNIVQ